MTPNEATRLILKESEDGIAYTSRMGNYSTQENFDKLIEAIKIMSTELRDRKQVDRKLFAALFCIGNQVEGNVHGALAKDIPVPDWLFDEGIIALNEALYEIFEDHGYNEP